MNRLPEVMRFVGGETETQEQTAAVIARVKRCWEAWGTSWWAFIDLRTERVAGAGCVQFLRRGAAPPEDLDSLRNNPLEIGWRLHPDFWGLGFASEAARCMTGFAFHRFPIEELLAVRHPDNNKSGRVMDRLGMSLRGLEQWYGTIVAVHVISRLEWQSTTVASGEE